MNERNMRMMMKRMGMSTEPMAGVEEVVIRRAHDEVVLKGAEVTVVTVQGIKTYQITGEESTRPRGPSSGAAPTSGGAPPAPAEPAGPPEEDIQLVMEQGQVDRPTAVSALRAAGGEPAEAILKLLSQRKS